MSPARLADTITVDFETGPALGTPVTTEYETSALVRLLASDLGFRPFRRAALGRTAGSPGAALVGVVLGALVLVSGAGRMVMG